MLTGLGIQIGPRVATISVEHGKTAATRPDADNAEGSRSKLCAGELQHETT
jgi:hypothetical protein